MREYQSNSHRSKELAAETPRAKKEKVVNGKVKTKKNEKRSLFNMFISEDVGNIKTYIRDEILIPTLKKTISEVVNNSTDMFLYGDTRGGKRSSSSKVSYRKYYDDRDSDRRDYHGARTRFDYEDLEFETRGDAEKVKRHMLDASETYGLVTVADMYDFAGITAPFTAQNYGWVGLRHVDVMRGKDCYYLKLPKAMPID